MSFLRLAEFRDEKDGRCDQTFCGIVEVAVLTEAARFHAGENDGLGNDFGVLFRLGFVLYFIRPGIQIHVLVDEVQKVVSVRAHGIAQINDRNVIAIILGGDRAVVAHDVTLGIGREKRHPGSTGVFDIGIEPICSFTHACGTDHHTMNITGIHKCRCRFLFG